MSSNNQSVIEIGRWGVVLYFGLRFEEKGMYFVLLFLFLSGIVFEFVFIFKIIAP